MNSGTSGREGDTHMNEFLEQLFSAINVTTPVGKLTYLVVVILAALIAQHFAVKFSSNALRVAEVPQASIFINILRGFIWSLALLLVLHPVFGIEPTAFVTALGVTSFAVSLGMQDTISNMFGGLTLMVAHIIMPGDFIAVGGFSGTVSDITWRNTIVKARNGNVEYIPNSVLSTTSFTKLTDKSAAAVTMHVAVDKSADYDKVAEEICAIVVKALGDLLVPGSEPKVRFGDVDALAVDASVIAFVWPDANAIDAIDLMSRGLAGKPWQVRISSPEQGVAASTEVAIPQS